MKKLFPPGFLFIIGVLMLAISVAPALASPEEAPLWSQLQAGPYDPGFTTVEIADETRTDRPKTDYFGTPNQGDRTRLIVVSVWYPAMASDDASTMFYGEYQFPSPKDDRFVPASSAIQSKSLNTTNAMIGPTGAAVIDVVNIPMAAFRNAPHAEGRFPLVIYHESASGTSAQNVVLGEYLASHGYVVAAVSPMGINGLRLQNDQRDLECQVRDLELTIAQMMEQEYVDSDHLAVVGHGTGAVVATALQMRSYDIDALACLDPAFMYGQGVDLLTENPFYDPLRMRVPMMVVYRGDDPTADPQVIEQLKYADRYVQAAQGVTPYDFTSLYGLVTTLLDRNDSLPAQNHYRFYSSLAEDLRGFLGDELTSEEETATWPVAVTEQSVAEPGAWSHLTAAEAPPSPSEFRQILLSQDPGRAVDLYHKFKAKDSSLVLFEYNVMLYSAYQTLRAGQTDMAIRMFELNCDAYPQLANAWDSYAEALLAADRTEEMVAASRKVLELLPDDNTLTPDFKETLRNNATTRINEATGASGDTPEPEAEEH